ncbi:MAG: thioredoxin family protein [Bacilli bacterium]
MKNLSTIEQFNEAIASPKPVIVKFYTTWCPDCVRMDMFIPPIVEEYNDFEWYTANRDELMELGHKYEVMGIPSLLVFKDGEKQAHLHSANAKTPEEVEAYLEKHLK